MPNSMPRGMFTLSVAYGPAFVLIAASGIATSGEICGALAMGSEISRREGKRQFLFDMMSVHYTGNTTEREEMGRFAASLLTHVDKIAVALSSEVNTGEGEAAAQDSGLNLRNFTSLPDAIEWLEA